MTRVFVLADALASDDAARQLALTLPRLTQQVRVGVLGECGPAAEALRQANIPLQRLPFRHSLDLGALVQIRRAVAESGADVLHAVGPLAVRLSRFLRAPRLVVSAAASPAGFLGWLTQRQVRSAAKVICSTNRDEADYRQRNVRPEQLVRVPLAVGEPTTTADGAKFRASVGIPPDTRLILTAGRLERAAGLRDAVWGFDVLKYESPDLRLVIVGDGPDREKLDAFGRALGFDDYRIHFAGDRPDLASLVHLASAVWVTPMRGGTTLALEAMAAGKPVLAWKGSEAAELIRDGETGLLAPHPDRVALASKTRVMLEDASLAARMGQAAKERAMEFDATRVAAALAEVYTQELREGF